MDGYFFSCLVALSLYRSQQKQASLFAALLLLSAVRLVRMLKRLATDDDDNRNIVIHTLTHMKRPAEKIYDFDLTFHINGI